MDKKTILIACVLVTSALASVAAETNHWDASLAAGATLTKGNSDTFLGNITFNANRKAPRDEILLGAGVTYGTTENRDVLQPNGTRRDETETTTANASAFGQYNHLFNEKFYGG